MATVYPKKYAHGFVVLCFVVVMQSFIMNSNEVFIHIHQDCFTGTGAIVRLPQCQWSKPDGYGKISQCITTTKQKPCAYFLGYTVIQAIPLDILTDIGWGWGSKTFMSTKILSTLKISTLDNYDMIYASIKSGCVGNVMNLNTYGYIAWEYHGSVTQKKCIWCNGTICSLLAQCCA